MLITFMAWDTWMSLCTGAGAKLVQEPMPVLLPLPQALPGLDRDGEGYMAKTACGLTHTYRNKDTYIPH